MIRINYSHGQVYVWRKKEEVLSFKCTKPTLKSLDKGIMIWGCMSSMGVGKIVILEGRVNAAVYLNLLKDVIIPEAQRLIGSDYILQQDNAPIHCAKIVKDYIRNENLNILTWPPQSPDLSPIENVWSLLKSRIAEKAPRNLVQLRQYIEEIWPTIDPLVCQKYVFSVPTRLATMASRKGASCGY